MHWTTTVVPGGWTVVVHEASDQLRGHLHGAPYGRSRTLYPRGLTKWAGSLRAPTTPGMV